MWTGALRLRLVASMDHLGPDFPLQSAEGDHPAVLLDLDCWALLPK